MLTASNRGGIRLVSGIRRAWKVLRPPQRRRLRILALCGIVIAGLDTVALLLVYALINVLNGQAVTGVARSVIDLIGVNNSDRYREALILLGITSLLFVARSLLSVMIFWLTVGAANVAQADLISRLLRGHARAPQLLRLERNTSETLRTILTSVDQVVLGVVASSVALVANTAVAVAVGLGLILASPLVAISITIYFALIAFAWGRGVRGPLLRRGRRIQELTAQRYQLVLQGIAAAKELQLRGRSLYFAEGAVERTRGINSSMRVVTVANGSLRYLLETALVVGAVLVVAVAGLTSGRAAALPAVGLVLAGAFRLLPALNQAMFLSNQVQFNAASISIVEQELATFGSFAETSADKEEAADDQPAFSHELRVDDVSFAYAGRDQPALDGVSFSVFVGESVGIVGPTGSGKSTLLDTILGMLEPRSGRLTIDGRPLPEQRKRWQRTIGYVPQDVYLVDDTLRANVALGWHGDEVDDTRVSEALDLAGLKDVVEALPHGVETVVGERGVRLSGGQRQRVGIARALYTRPTVLVLDEATSNLDQVTERRIVDTLRALPGGVTMIFVTHRIDSVRYCDRVVYLESGRLRAMGTFEQLRAAAPEFIVGGSSREDFERVT
jgi:ABC-type multidrug transport system fused ATPase/permease subunit